MLHNSQGIKMKKTLKLIAVTSLTIGSLAMVNVAQAGDRAFGDIYTECGIGSMVFANHPTMAAISNVTWDLGTTAVSSNISSPDTCNGSTASSAAFINDSYTILEQDIAKGEGEHLSALLSIMGCDDSAISVVREDFSEAVSTEGYSETTDLEKSEALFDIMHSSAVAASCSA